MGKAQSKRSVDITTEITPKDGKAIIGEGTGKMGKIEDVDQLKPQINEEPLNDQNIPAVPNKENKNESDGDAENEKDISTEKEQNNSNLEISDDADNKTIEINGVEDTINESKSIETPMENGENNKKPKKEKVKKKWSFRSISFSKKDKQKPSKKEEPINAECEKVLEEPQQDNTVLPVDIDKQSNVAEIAPKAIEEKLEEVTSIKANIEIQPISAILDNDELNTDTKEKILEHCEVIEKKNLESIAPCNEVTQHKEPDFKQEVKEPNLTKEIASKDTEAFENLEQNPPPPLPLIPPPSQATVFAETSMAINDQNINIISNSDLTCDQIVENKDNITETIAYVHKTSILSESQNSAEAALTNGEPEEISTNLTEKVSINDIAQIPDPAPEIILSEDLLNIPQKLEEIPNETNQTNLILTNGKVNVDSDQSLDNNGVINSEKEDTENTPNNIATEMHVSSVLDDGLPPPPIMEELEEVVSSIITNGEEIIDLPSELNSENKNILVEASNIINDAINNDLDIIPTNAKEVCVNVTDENLTISSPPIHERADENVNNAPAESFVAITQEFSEKFKQEQDKIEICMEKPTAFTEIINGAGTYEKTEANENSFTENIEQNSCLVSSSTPTTVIEIAE